MPAPYPSRGHHQVTVRKAGPTTCGMVDGEAQFERAARMMEAAERLYVSSIVLCELVWVLASAYGFRALKADDADCLIGRRNGQAGCDETITFDRALKSLPGARVL